MLILAAILTIFVYGVIAALLGTILPSYTDLSTEQQSYIALAQALGLTIASLTSGPLIDNKGKKVALLLGLGLVAGSLFVLPGADSYGVRISVFLTLGLGGGIIVTAGNALVSDVSEKRRASTLNFLNLFFGLGGLATPFVSANLLDNNLDRFAYLAAILTVGTWALFIVTRIAPPTGERSFKASEAGAVLSRPVLYLLALFMFLYVACEVGVWNWLRLHLQAQGIEETRAANILSLGFALGLLIGRVVVSPILIKVAPATVTLAAAVLMALTTYGMLQTTSPGVAWAAVFCAGLAMAPVFPTTLAMVGNAFPRMTATAMGIVITSGWIGLMVSSPIIGRLSGPDPSGLARALLILPAFSVIMIIVNLALRPMLARPATTV
jgi:fucose permease